MKIPDQKNDKDEKKWLIPPGLQRLVAQFEKHCRMSHGQPIMIVGPTGAGKSLFLEIAKDVFQETNKIGETLRKVIEANCAHFGGLNSDPNVSKAELFGCDETLKNATYFVKSGYIQKAHEGLLVLEEVGELPKEVQSMLLTFIETGKYRPVGVGEEEKDSRLVILAATNNEQNLRSDLRFRFLPFYVPALAARREDILYYMYFKYPDVVTALRPWEIFCLLSYNWPGNVREIDRVCFLIGREKESRNESLEDEHSLYNSSLAHVVEAGTKYSNINLEKLLNFETELFANSPKLHDQLEELLNKFGLGISLTKRNSLPFFNKESLEKGTIDRAENGGSEGVIQNHEKYVTKNNNEFLKVWYYYQLFCHFLDLNEFQNVNILSILNSKYFWRNLTAKAPKSVKMIKNYLSGRSDLLSGFDKYLENMRKMSLSEIKTSKLNFRRSIWSLSIKELENQYYNGLFLLTEGDKSAAAERAGVDVKTIKKHWKAFAEDKVEAESKVINLQESDDVNLSLEEPTEKLTSDPSEQ